VRQEPTIIIASLCRLVSSSRRRCGAVRRRGHVVWLDLSRLIVSVILESIATSYFQYDASCGSKYITGYNKIQHAL
jgi:hypothetical protein